MNEAQVLPLFSTPIYITNASGYVNDVIDFKKINFDEFYRSHDGKILVSNDQNILFDSRFTKIRQYCDQATEDFVYEVLKTPKELKLNMTCSWMMVGYPGSITQKHVHQNSVFSGIFYIQSGNTSGDLLLSQTPSIPTAFPSTLSPIPTEINILNSKTWAYKPQTNDIILFPSHTLHEVTPNQSKTFRCCIAFNYFLSGPISNERTECLNISLS